MPDTPTPGEIAYAAYVATGRYPAREYPPWRDLVPRDQQRWEAAAEAVLTAAGSARGVAVPGDARPAP